MIDLIVEDMHCAMCVARIDKALTDAAVLHKIDLESKTVSVEEKRVEDAKVILDDLGFEAV